MKMLAALSTLALTTVSAVGNLNTYTFDDYVNEFSKTYTSTEYNLRKQIFHKAKTEALQHNNALVLGSKHGKHTWTKAINEFSDLTSKEFSESHGWVNPKGFKEQDLDSFLSSEELNIPSNFKLSDLPKTIDWRTKGVVTDVKNQGMCGSCWAFSSTENIESHVAIHSNLTTAPVLSPQNLISCDPNPNDCGGDGGCRGSVPELAFDYVKQNGLASEADWPYVSGHTSVNEACNNTAKPAAHITGYVKLKANNYTEVMYTLANRGPVAVNVDAIPMQSYGGGLMTGCASDSTHIDHVVQLVGYGFDDDAEKPYWIMRNSWGTTWGISGYMHLERHLPKDGAYCGLDIKPLDGTGCTGGPGTLEVCGSCGVLWDVSYPIGGTVGAK